MPGRQKTCRVCRRRFEVWEIQKQSSEAWIYINDLCLRCKFRNIKNERIKKDKIDYWTEVNERRRKKKSEARFYSRR